MHFFLKWRWELLLPLIGVLLTLAFAPFNYAYLAILSLSLVFQSWLNCSALRATLRGFLYGLGLFSSGIYWVYISLHDFGGAPVIGAVLLTLLIICFWSLFPALIGYLSVRLSGKNNTNRLLLLIPFLWIFIEYARGQWLLNGFPWLQIAYTQLETPLQGFVPLLGVYGTGFLLACSATLIVAGFNKRINPLLTTLTLALIWGSGTYLQTIKWTAPIGDEIKVALIQGNVAQDQKWAVENRVKTLIDYRKMTEQQWDADVIIWPETAIPAYLSQIKDSYLTPLSAQAKKNNTDLIVSLPIKEGQSYYNAVISLGHNSARYYKNHLLPFGEYLPLQPLSGFVLNSLNIRLGTFTSGGDEQPLLTAGGYPFATSICYEDAFSQEATRHMPKAAFLVNVTNDAWFGDSIEPYQHMQIAQMRALETGRYLLRVTNTGVTAIVAPNGQIIKKVASFKKTVLTGTIIPMGGNTPYANLGDNIFLFYFLLGSGLLWQRRLNNDSNREN